MSKIQEYYNGIIESDYLKEVIPSSSGDYTELYDIIDKKTHCSHCGGNMLLGMYFNDNRIENEYYCENLYKPNQEQDPHAYLRFTIEFRYIDNMTEKTPIEFLQKILRARIDERNKLIDECDHPQDYGKVLNNV